MYAKYLFIPGIKHIIINTATIPITLLSLTFGYGNCEIISIDIIIMSIDSTYTSYTDDNNSAAKVNEVTGIGKPTNVLVGPL